LKSQASSSPKQGARALIAMVTIALAAVYGGYFGAGLSVIVLALLALLFEDNLTHLNALKQSIAFAANTSAAIVFLFSGQIRWGVVGVMAVSALLGGSAGGKLAGRINPVTLRWIVVTIGLIVSLVFFVQIYFLR